MVFFGYVFDQDERYTPPTSLDDKPALSEFIKANWEAKQLIITDRFDKQLLHMRDGVDLFNKLDQIGIQLSSIFQDIRENLVADQDASGKAGWEQLYDSIGLSAGEIRMRQRVKQACKEAQTVSDVIELVQGTYFDVDFISTDHQRCWRYFDIDQRTAEVMIRDDHGNWSYINEEEVIPLDARVAHLRSGEDIHEFILLDPPLSNKNTSDKRQ